MIERRLLQMAFVFLLGILFESRMRGAAAAVFACFLLYLAGKWKRPGTGDGFAGTCGTRRSAGTCGTRSLAGECGTRSLAGECGECSSTGTCGMYRSRLLYVLPLVACFVVSAANARYHTAIRRNSMEKWDESAETIIRGEVYKKEFHNNCYYFYLKNCQMTVDRCSMPIHPLLAQFAADSYSIGETLTLSGQLHTFSVATNPGQFDRRDYYHSLNIDFYMREPAVLSSVRGAEGLRERLYRFRESFAAHLILLMGEEDGGILSAMLLGEKSLLNEEIRQEYQRSGISHILAISGLHVSLIGMGIYKRLRKMRQGFGRAGAFSGICLAAYVFLTGSGVSAVRAAGMLGLFWLAEAIGRSYDTLNALGAMAIALLWQNPFLIGNTGFLFSFLAILGVCAAPALFPGRKEAKNTERDNGNLVGFREMSDGEDSGGTGTERGALRFAAVGFAGCLGKSNSENARDKNGSRMRKWRMAILRGLAVSVSVWLFTAPVMAYSYYELPVYSMLINLLVLPLAPILLLSGIAAGCASFFSMFAARALAMPCRFILLWYHWLCRGIDQLPHNPWIVGQPEAWRLCCYAGVLLLWVWTGLRRRRKRQLEAERNESSLRSAFWKSVCPVTGIPCLFLILAVRIPSGSEITVLDVGQGDGIYLRTSDGVCAFIDGGSSNVSNVGTYRILPFLKAKGVPAISFWFVSHTDSDHISGISEVLESGYPVRYLVFDRGFVQEEAFAQLAGIAQKHHTKVWFLDSGDSVRTTSAAFSDLSPKNKAAGWDDNGRSLALLFEDGGFRAFFGGDISSEVEQAILEAQGTQAEQTLGKDLLANIDFYKVSHHGSKYSNSRDFLQHSAPKIAVISCGAKNRYGHPHPETMERLEEAGVTVFRTDEDGAIILSVKNGRVVIRPFLSGR